MEIIVKDSFGNMVELGDVVLLTYPNEKLVCLGVLKFTDDYDFVLHDGEKVIEHFPRPGSWIESSRICRFTERPELDNLLGIQLFKKKKELWKFMSMIK